MKSLVMLRYRQKSVQEADPDTRKPFGVPIYELLTSLKRKAEDSDLSNDVSKHSGASNTVKSSKPSKKRRKISPMLAQKYSPNEFFDLIGNDDSNRRILKWMSTWERAIANYGKKGNKTPALEDVDEYGRPLHKILLISGPPGVGKTTAAHVIAKQKGFVPLEVNASDERGSKVIREKVGIALGSHQVISTKPVCIIADEVDGAEQGFVKSLMYLVNKKKPKKGDTILMRPIIAVCNNLYSSTLHSLRPHCEIVRFERHAPALLLRRLSRICELENISKSTKELTELATINQFDMRACLNSLQFDSGEDTGFIVSDPVLLARSQLNGKTPLTFSQIESCGDHDKMLDTLFDQYIYSDFVDDRVQKPSKISDFYELTDSRFANDDHKSVLVHAFGSLFRRPGANGLSTSISSHFNTTSQQKSTKNLTNAQRYEYKRLSESVLSQVLNGSEPIIRATISKKVALLEFAPFLTKLVCPLNEAKRIESVARALKSVGLKFQLISEEANFNYILNPPIEQVVVYNDKANVRIGQSLTRGAISQAMEQLGLTNSANNTLVKDTSAASTDSNPNTKQPQDNINIPSKRTAIPATGKVWVQFSEGFSNAVRKPITWNDLFDS